MDGSRPDDWLQHTEFLRGLARRLVADEARAEDAVQETMLVALTRPPRDDGNVRGWLARVLRRAVGDARRGEGRRGRREAAAARDEALPSDALIVERMETTQRVTAAVLELPEAYRAVIHLRFYEGLSAREIADRSGLPLETVRTREKRAVARLRERLDRSFDGDRRAWLGALAPIAGVPLGPSSVPPPSTLLPIGTLLVTTKTKAALVAGALALIAVVVLRIPGSPGRTADRLEEPAADIARVESAASADEESPVVAATTAPERVAATDAPAEPAAPAANPDVLAVAGRLLLTDVAGVERDDRTGRMLIGVTHRGQFEWRTVEVEQGRFGLEVPPGSALSFARLRFDGLAAIPEIEERGAPEDGELLLRARLVPRPLLHVVDAETGEPLRNVEVKYRSAWRAWGEDVHPGDHADVKSVTGGADSPILLPAYDRRCAYWARADGYAWGRITVEHETGGERTLALVRGGRLDVRLAGAEVPADTFIRLRGTSPTGRTIAAEKRASADGTVTFDHLVPDDYRVFVEAGSFSEAVIIGFLRVTLEAGAHETVEVAIDPSKLVVTRVPLAGTLRIDPSLADGGLRLRLEHVAERGERSQPVITLGAEDLAPVEGRDDLRSWDAGEVLPGTYMVWVGTVQHREELTVDVPGNDRVEIVVPPPAEVAVRFTNADGGGPVVPARAFWADASLDEFRFGNLNMDLYPDGATGEAGFTTCAGPLRIRVEDPRFGSRTLEVDAKPGSNEVEFALERVCSVDVSVFVGDARLSLHDEPIEIALTRPGVERAYRQRSGDGESELFVVLGPGDYELRVDAGEAYEPLEPIAVPVGPGEQVEVKVELVRR